MKLGLVNRFVTVVYRNGTESTYKIKDSGKESDLYQSLRNGYILDYRLWLPKEGDWVWLLQPDLLPVFRKYSNGMVCEPFLGTLPSLEV